MGWLGLRCYAIALSLLLFPAFILRHRRPRPHLVEQPREPTAVRTRAESWRANQTWVAPAPAVSPTQAPSPTVEPTQAPTQATTQAPTQATTQAPTQAPACFVHDVKPCANGEGVAGLFRRLQWGIALAVKYGCSYVCNPSAWQTGGHGTGNVGHLFGCEEGKVLDEPGRMVSRNYIKGLWAEVCASLKGFEVRRRRSPGSAAWRAQHLPLSPRL